MRRRLFFLSLLALLFLAGKAQTDEDVYDRYRTAFREKAGLPTGDLMVETARFLLGLPYVAGTLEREPEELVVNLRELDCTTLVENVLALTWSLKHCPSFDVYKSALRHMRYRNADAGEPLDYTDRLHYTSDWIYENERRGYLKDVTREIGGKPLALDLSFMSAHPESYKPLKDNPHRIAAMATKEKDINARAHFYIPEDEIGLHADRIQNGDIVCFVTTVKGLDVSHVGIICREAGRLTFIHASTVKKQVIVNEEPLQEYVRGNRRNRGIILVRPQF